MANLLGLDRLLGGRGRTLLVLSAYAILLALFALVFPEKSKALYNRWLFLGTYSQKWSDHPRREFYGRLGAWAVLAFGVAYGILGLYIAFRK